MRQRVLAISLLVGGFVPLFAALAPQSVVPLASIVVNPAHAASPLAPSLQGKPVFVEIYASWCPACQTIKPAVQTLRKQEGNNVHWVRFDVSNTASAKKSAARAQELGLADFFNKHRSQTSLVSIFNPETGVSVSTFRAQPELDPYLRAINTTRSMIRR